MIKSKYRDAYVCNFPGAGYSKITYERALKAVKCNLDKCSVSVTLIAIPKPHLRSS